jgi:hypothetical protein
VTCPDRPEFRYVANCRQERAASRPFSSTVVTAAMAVHNHKK